MNEAKARMNPRLLQMIVSLRELNSVHVEITEGNYLSRTYTNARIYNLPNITYQYRNSLGHIIPGKQPFQAAYSELLPDMTLERLKQIRKAYWYIKIYHIPTEFCQTYLYRGINGSYVTDSPHLVNLQHHLENFFPGYSLNYIKRITGQAVHAIYDLHTNNLVHRNISETNFLVYQFQDGKPCLRLDGLEDVIRVNPDGFAIDLDILDVINPANRAPEISNFLHYKICNLKAADCYSLGRIIFTLFNMALPEGNKLSINDIKTNNTDHAKPALGTPLWQLYQLAVGLTNPDISQRMTINEAVGNILFGRKRPERKEFFQKLKEDASYQLIIDNHSFTRESVLIGDAFLLADTAIKNIFTAANEIVTIIKEIKDFLLVIHPDLDAIRGMAKRYKEIDTHFTAYILSMSKILQNDIQPNCMPTLLDIKPALEAEILWIDSHYRIHFPSFLKVMIETTLNECLEQTRQQSKGLFEERQQRYKSDTGLLYVKILQFEQEEFDDHDQALNIVLDYIGSEDERAICPFKSRLMPNLLSIMHKELPDRSQKMQESEEYECKYMMP